MRECRHGYIPGSLCKGASSSRGVSSRGVSSRGVPPECVGLFDFVVSHYVEDIDIMRYSGVWPISSVG